MKIKFELRGIEPITLNHCYTYSWKNGKFKKFTNDKYSELCTLTQLELRRYQDQIREFNNFYDPTKHVLKFDYRFYYNILTKKNYVSMHSKDLSNCIKPIEDIIFKAFSGADDSQVISLNCMKIQSDKIKTIVKLEVLDLSSIV